MSTGTDKRTYRTCPNCAHREQPGKPKTDMISHLTRVEGMGEDKVMYGTCRCPTCNSTWNEIFYAKTRTFTQVLTERTDHKPRLFED